MKRFVSVLAVLALSASVVSAGTIATGSYVFDKEVATNVVTIRVTDGGSIISGQITLQISPISATSPKITGGDITGTVFASSLGAAASSAFADYSGNAQQKQLTLQNSGSNTVNLSGSNLAIGNFTVSTVGVPNGVYTLSIIGIEDGGDTNLNPFPANDLLAVNGTITVIPEPASALLLIGALPFLRRRSA